jgi:PAS domain S-box-containing protein
MAGKLRVLMLEDVAADAELSEHELKKAGFQIITERVETKDAFIAALDEFKPDIVLGDYNLPTWDGISALAVMREKHPELPFIFVSGTIGEELAIDAMKAGATDYVLKTKLSKLGMAVKRALDELEHIKELKHAEESIKIKNRMLTAIYDYSQAIAFAPPEKLYITIVTKLKDITGSVEVLINDYDEGRSELVCRQSTLSEEGNTWVRKMLGGRLIGYKTPVTKEKYDEIVGETVGRVGSLHEVTFGAVSAPVGQMIEKMLGVSWFVGLALIHDGRLMGTVMIGGRKGAPEPANEELLAYASATANLLARRRAEISLIASEKKYREIVETMNDVVFTLDLEGNVIDASPSMTKVVGWSVEDILKKPFSNYVHPNDLAKAESEFINAIQGIGKPIEIRIVRPDNTPVWIHINALLILRDNEPENLLCVLSDINERKLAESVIIESESKFRQLSENIDMVFWLTDWKEKKLLYVNPAYEKVFGLTVESAYADRTGWKKAIHPEDLEWADREFQRHAAAGEPLELDYRIVRDGNIKWIRERALPLKDEKGQVVQYINVAEDITERKHVEEALAKNQALLHESQHMAKIGGWEFFVDTLSQTWTEETFRILEVEYDHGAPRVPEGVSFIAPEYRPMADTAIQRAMEFGEPYDQEWEVVTAKGNRKWVRAVAKVNRTEGKITSVSGSFQDITEHKLAEMKIVESTSRYRELIEGISDCVAVYRAVDEGKDFIFLDMNRAGEKVEKIKRSDIIGRRVTEVFPGVHEMGMLDMFRRVWRTGVPEQQPATLYKDERIQGWRENYVYRLPTGELVAIYEDVTAKKMAVEAVFESEKKYRELFDNAGDAILIADTETAFLLDANKAAEKLLGRTRDELLGLNRLKIHPPIESGLYVDDFERHIASNQTVDAESTVLRKDGTIVPVRITTNVFEIHGKKVIQGIFRDITERKRAEEELRLSNERFFKSFHSSPILMSISEADTGRFVDVNEAMAQTYGMPREDIIGKISTELGVWTDPDTRKKTLAHIEKFGFIRGIDFPLKTRTGEMRALLWSGDLVQIAGMQYLLASALDITERKRAEHLAQERIKELNAFFNLSEITERDGITLNDVYQEFANVMPESWQYPEVACARIIVGDREFRSANYAESAWKQSAPIYVNGSTAGMVEINYLEEKPEASEGPFVMEERQLINAIAERIGDITERKLAEEALAASDAQYRLIAENMADTIWLMDLDMTVTYISPSVIKTRGYTLEELNVLPLDKQMTPESFEMVMNVFESEMTPERLAQKDLQISHTFELEFYRKDGSRFWADVTMTLLRDADGNPTSMLGVGRDITERRNAREAMVASEEKYRVLVETMHEGLWTLDENSKITFVNPRMAEMLGYTKEEMLGKYLFDFMDEQGIIVAQENIERRRTGISEVHDLEFIRKDGSKLFAQLATGPIQGKDGKYLGAIAGIQDITERKLAEKALLERKTLESRYTLTKIMTDVVPALLTMGRGEKSKDEFMGEMMRRLDAAFYDKYFPTEDGSMETFGNRICALMNDLGGEFKHRIDGAELRIVGAGCPWKNDVSRNPILCMIDRGLIERFANKSLGSVGLNQITSRANGDSTCEFVISKTG